MLLALMLNDYCLMLVSNEMSIFQYILGIEAIVCALKCP